MLMKLTADEAYCDWPVDKLVDNDEAYYWLMFPSQGNVPVDQMAKTFNCGIGAVLVVAKGDENGVIEMLQAAGEKPVNIGAVIPHMEGGWGACFLFLQISASEKFLYSMYINV